MKESPYLEGQDQVIERIKGLPVFKQYPRDELKGLLRLSKIRQYDTHEVIIEEGTNEKWIYFLISGKVQIEKNENVVARLQNSGEVFGELGFLDEGPRSSTVRATASTSCLAVDAAYLLEIQEKGNDSFHSAIYKMFAQILAYRLRETTQKYVTLKRDHDRVKKIAGLV